MTKGRKRAVGVKRTASGRRSRAAAAYEENADPIQTRMRLFGLSEADARDQKAATFVGRLQLTRVISTVQYDAAVEYLSIIHAARRAIAAPDGLRDSGGTAGDRGDTPEYSAWCDRAKAARNAADAAVMREQCLLRNRGTNLFAALDYVVLRDEVAWHLVGDARLALNALAHHLGLIGKRALAA
jgi:hypothetical protein